MKNKRAIKPKNSDPFLNWLVTTDSLRRDMWLLESQLYRIERLLSESEYVITGQIIEFIGNIGNHIIDIDRAHKLNYIKEYALDGVVRGRIYHLVYAHNWDINAYLTEYILKRGNT